MAISKFAHPFLCAAVLAVLGGCVSNSNPPAPIYTPETNPTQPLPAPSDSQQPPAVPSNPESSADQQSKMDVTLALLEQSDSANTAGNPQQAVTYVERAIRINPRRSDLWVRLAKLTLSLNQPVAAEGYARKAISLAGQRLDWQRDAWLIVADAKAAQGDTEAANDIRERWRTGRG